MAGPLIRSLAWMIDAAILVGSILILGMIVGVLGMMTDFEIAVGIYQLFFFVLYWFYYVYFESGKHGATPGKRTMGLRVVQPSGTPISFTQAVIRNFLRFIDGLPYSPAAYFLAGGGIPIPSYLIGLTACACTRRFQRLGDLAANTVVIYARSEVRPAIPLREDIKATPPGLPLTRADQLASVTYVERASLWSDERKEELANHVAPLTGATGRAAVDRLFSLARWIQRSS
jgi:uncharacterized RDD family membrane protein YckC